MSSTVDKRHITKLQGRDFVTYEGLLDMAHRAGLVEIRTQLIQAPSAENDHTAICSAEVVLLVDGVRRVFCGIGDANPRNVSRNIAIHLIRMSETRSKARALRDAVNVGMCAVEELELADLPGEVGDRRPDELELPPDGSHPEAPIAKAAIDRIGREMKRVGMTPEEGRAWLTRQFGKQSRLELTQNEGERFLEHLKAQASAVQEKAA